MKHILLILNFFFLQQTTAQPTESLPQPVITATSVDLQKYLGSWFEIASIPQSFQKQCVGNTKADYSLAENDLIAVVNSCDTLSGERSIATGRAKVIDTKSNSKLQVTFVNILGWQFMFGGDYWIIALGENYSYAVVGSPNRDYAWILSRTPELPAALLREATQTLVTQGYNTCKLITTFQAGGLQVKTPLCKLEMGK